MCPCTVCSSKWGEARIILAWNSLLLWKKIGCCGGGMGLWECIISVRVFWIELNFRGLCGSVANSADSGSTNSLTAVNLSFTQVKNGKRNAKWFSFKNFTALHSIHLNVCLGLALRLWKIYMLIWAEHETCPPNKYENPTVRKQLLVVYVY